jgi:hypothetical protein
MRSVLGSVAGQVVHTGILTVALVRRATLPAAKAPMKHSTLAVATG